MAVWRPCIWCGKAFQATAAGPNRHPGKLYACSMPCRWAHKRSPEYFWDRVDRSGGPDACWPWTRAIQSGGYGSLVVDGRPAKAHRVAWELTHGPIQDGLSVLHDCDRRYAKGDIAYRRCVNPAHLWLGDDADNNADMITKGRERHPRGANVRRAKIDEADVVAIRAAYAAGVRPCDLAARYGLSSGGVAHIVSRRCWRHIP